MTVKYKIVERGNPADPTAHRKFYPSIHSTGRVSTRQLAEQAAQESTMSPADIMAAVESFLAIVPRELARGNIVELGDFGKFWLRVEVEGAASADEVHPSRITGTKPRFNPGRKFKQVLDTLEFVREE